VELIREEGVKIGDEDEISKKDEKMLGRIVKDKYENELYILDK
jgi:aspartyl-tRNA synthetase